MTPRSDRQVPAQALSAELRRDIVQAGYYPALVADVVGEAVGAAPIASHLVHQETTFDGESVRRHVTVLVRTDTSLVVAHADDHEGGESMRADSATATTEIVPLGRVRGVMVTHVVADPQRYRPGELGREVTVTIGWGAVSRMELLPATCGDPTCEADHGYDGTIAADDISLRISADADGLPALRAALAFARDLSAAIGHAR